MAKTFVSMVQEKPAQESMGFPGCGLKWLQGDGSSELDVALIGKDVAMRLQRCWTESMAVVSCSAARDNFSKCSTTAATEVSASRTMTIAEARASPRPAAARP